MALSNTTGEIIWSTPRKVKISWASPVVAFTGTRTELMLVSEPYVASYNPDNGQELWKLDCVSGEVAPSLAYSKGIVFSENDNSKLTAIRIGEQPEVLWEHTDFLSDVPSPVATDKYLFLVTGYGTVVCYNALTGIKYWEHDFNKDVFSSPVIAEEKVYLLDRDGMMHIFKADKEYASAGESNLGEKTVATPAFSNGHIYIRGVRNLYCIGKEK
jgi:outer membrane protein assembly factor BamB